MTAKTTTTTKNSMTGKTTKCEGGAKMDAKLFSKQHKKNKKVTRTRRKGKHVAGPATRVFADKCDRPE